MTEWLSDLFLNHTSVQAVIVIALICAIGLMLGKVKFMGVSLGVTFVFFVGILAGHFGVTLNHDVLVFAENFGLVLFVYALGLQVGPGFFGAFSKGGLRMNMLSLILAIVSLAIAVSCVYLFGVNIADMMGVWSGATTNTPALAAAQQALVQLGIPASSTALGCAVTYPLGVVGVILATIILKKLFVNGSNYTNKAINDKNHTKITAFQVQNPAIFNKTVAEIARTSQLHFVISRLWRKGKVSIPAGNTEIRQGDRILVVSNDEDSAALLLLFGVKENTDWNKEDIDWNAIDRQLVSQQVLVTRSELNGKHLGSLKLRSRYAINISRVYRSGVLLLATPDLRLQFGDRLTVVGEQKAVEKVAEELGNTVKSLDEPNLVPVFIGMLLGLALGAIPFHIPTISMPVKLGIAGGPIIMGILVGRFGPSLHMVTYTTQSANLMLRAIGLSIYLACLGLDSGAGLFETVIYQGGALWVLLGFVITVVPCILMGIWCLKVLKIDFATTTGMLCGSMANPMALNYANDIIPGDETSVAYATVYPLSMFARIVMVQIIILLMV